MGAGGRKKSHVKLMNVILNFYICLPHLCTELFENVCYKMIQERNQTIHVWLTSNAAWNLLTLYLINQVNTRFL